MEYTVLKSLNNNAVLLEHEGEVYIGMGSGLGFGKKMGDTLKKESIHKIFEETSNQFMTKLSKSISKLDENLYPLVDKIVLYIKNNLNILTTDQLYLALAEHIGFTKVRIAKGITVPCPMEHEIKLLYPSEYKIASEVVAIIENELKLSFPKSEIGLISLHIINTAYVSPKEEVTKQFEMVLEIVEIIQNHYSKKLDESSLAYARLLTHLNFLGKRIFMASEKLEISNNTQSIFFNSNCIEAISCSNRIKLFVEENYDFTLSVDEVNYLIIHIQNCMGSI